MSDEKGCGMGLYTRRHVLPILTTRQCDSARPSCTTCRTQAVACNYRSSRLLQADDLRRQLSAHEELVHHLRSVPEEQAIQLLRQLRAVEDLQGLLASAEGGAAHSLL